MTRDSVKIEYIDGGQLSPYELAFGVEIGPNPHSKMISEPILDPFKSLSSTLARDNAKIEYISGG